MEENNIKSQMKKGILEFCILQIISEGEVYASDILNSLVEANLIVVEGTLYPLLSRLTREELIKYKWAESPSGPPRKYYLLTKEGKNKLVLFRSSWEDLSSSINILLNN